MAGDCTAPSVAIGAMDSHAWSRSGRAAPWIVHEWHDDSAGLTAIPTWADCAGGAGIGTAAAGPSAIGAAARGGVCRRSTAHCPLAPALSFKFRPLVVLIAGWAVRIGAAGVALCLCFARLSVFVHEALGTLSVLVLARSLVTNPSSSSMP